MEKIFRVEHLACGYEELTVLSDICFSLEEGEALAVVGINGAGKTTLFRTLAGLELCRNGTIWYRERRIEQLSPPQRVQLGISLVPEGRQVFEELTVNDNLKAGGYLSSRNQVMELVAVYNQFPQLRNLSKRQAGYLSGGEQQQLAIARAMMVHPKILLLDEPTMGLSVKMARIVYQTIEQLKKRGITILLSGQDVAKTLAVSDKALFLENGRGSVLTRTQFAAHGFQLDSLSLSGKKQGN